MTRHILMMMLAGALLLARPAAAETQSGFLTVAGTPVHYVTEGEGEPVLLIHAMDSTAAINWQTPGTMDLLAKDHFVIAYDLPGYGQSGRSDDGSAYGQGWVDDAVALLDHFHIKKAHIVGYSLGGMIALNFIVEHPGRVISGTLGGMGYLPKGPMQRVWTHMRPPASSAADLALTAEQVLGVTSPVRIFSGDHDPVRRLYVDPLLRVRDDWKVVSIPGAGHLTCIMKPAFRQGIEDWLNENRQQ